MNLTSYAKAALAVFLFLSLSAGVGCEQQQASFRLNLERVPQYYRDCVSKVTTLPKGTLTYQQTVALLVKLRKSELRLSKCGKETIAWADAQVAAYMK